MIRTTGGIFPGDFRAMRRMRLRRQGARRSSRRSLRGFSALTKLRREHAALECGGEQVLVANADWLVTLRDMGHQRAERCEAKGGGASRVSECCGAASWEWRLRRWMCRRRRRGRRDAECRSRCWAQGR